MGEREAPAVNSRRTTHTCVESSAVLQVDLIFVESRRHAMKDNNGVRPHRAVAADVLVHRHGGVMEKAIVVTVVARLSRHAAEL